MIERSACVAFHGIVRAVGSAFGIFLTLLLLLGSPKPLRAQSPSAGVGSMSVVLGRLVDSESGDPLQTVQVTVRPLRDSTVVATGLTDRSGRFVLSSLPAGEYSVAFSRIGYATRVQEMRLGGETSSADLGSISLLPSALLLDEVSVIADRPAVVYEPDRDVYSVDAMLEAAGGSATDALAAIPDLEVGVDGKVTMRGESPSIYINGRPAPMRGQSLDAFLQGFPAENIETIEVMSNPSARYQSEGAGGIVNIVLKRGVSLGLTGNYSLNAGTRGEYGASGRVTRQGGDLTLLASGSLRMSERSTNSSELRQNLRADPITYLGQDAVSERATWSGNASLSAEYAFTRQTRATVEGRLQRNDNGTDRTTTYTEMLEDFTVTDRHDRTALDDSFGTSTDLSLELRHEFARRHTLTGQIELQRGSDTQESLTRRRILADAFPENEVFQLLLDDARENDSQLRLRFDYARPLGSGQVEIGLASTLASNDVDRERWSGIDAPDAARRLVQDSEFEHRETVHALYVTGNRRMGDLNAQLGVRAEHTSVEFELPNELGISGNSYLNVFPNANVTYQFENGRRVRLSYSVRVRRPAPNVLDPTNRSTDPFNRRVGNPNVDPQFTHNLSLDASWSGRLGTLRMTPFLRRSVDEWAQFKEVDGDGIGTTTWANLAQTTAYGSSLTADLRSLLGFQGSISLNGQLEHRDWDEVVGRDSRESTRWSLRTNLSRFLTRTLSVQSSMTYTPPRDLPQGTASATVMTNLGVRQRLFANRATLSLTVTDPLGIYRTSTNSRDASYVESNRDRASARRASISFSYNFGARSRGGSNNRGGNPGAGAQRGQGNGGASGQRGPAGSGGGGGGGG